MPYDAPDPLDATPPTVLADLFALGRRDTEVGWSDDDLGAILTHQLAQPAEDPSPGDPAGTARTYLVLFTEPLPPVGLLRAAKDRFKINPAAHDPADLPRDVCIALYYAALAAARHHAGTTISQLDDKAFRIGLNWALELPWVHPALRELFTEALPAQGSEP
ncbi:MAG: hypothetical protein AAF333_04955 [Planctomycetota bacterium]